MSDNVWVKCGHVYNMLSEVAPPTGAVTGNWIRKDSPWSTFQATMLGTGTVGATVNIQASNDGITPVATALGTITLSAASPVSDGFATVAPWKFVRAVVSAPSGIISGISVLMGV